MNKIKERILTEIENIKVIDSHEHLMPEKDALKKRTALVYGTSPYSGIDKDSKEYKRDIFSMFSTYSLGDLKVAGLNKEQASSIFNNDVPLDVRWNVFAPLWQKIRYTCYSKCLLYSIKKFYGYDDITEKNYQNISQAIEESCKPGLYRKVIRDVCNIDIALTQCYRTEVDPDKNDPLLLPVMPLYLGCGSTKASWESFEALRTNGPLEGYYGYTTPWKYNYNQINSLDDCLDNQLQYLKDIKREGAVGVKFGTAPEINSTCKPDRKKALELFNGFKNGSIKKLNHPNELHYYLLDRAIEHAVKEDFIISVHTGGYSGDPRIYSPLNLIPFLIRYPEGKFDVYHLGYPWIRESIMLAKGYPNVTINLCWVYAISQKAAEDALDEIIETIPVNKVIGFGADITSDNIENIYGHLKMAKESMASVFAKKILDGYIDFDSSIDIIKRYFFYNPKELYGL